MTANGVQLSQAADAINAATVAAIARLARDASVEMTMHDRAQLRAAQRLLAPNARIYVSFLPNQTWRDTLTTCDAISAIGLQPVPHLPVRRLADDAGLHDVLRQCVRAGAHEVMLIGGDIAQPMGRFAATTDVLRLGLLAALGIERLSVAAHPEGHPSIDPYELRRAEREKLELAEQQRLSIALLTQFFFDAQPFLDWRRRLPRNRAALRIVAGLAGPAKLTTLLRYAALCGVGASARTLSSRADMVPRLLHARGPAAIVRAIAQASLSDAMLGLHLFSFGGLERTCAWLAAVAAGDFQLDDNGGFTLQDE